MGRRPAALLEEEHNEVLARVLAQVKIQAIEGKSNSVYIVCICTKAMKDRVANERFRIALDFHKEMMRKLDAVMLGVEEWQEAKWSRS